MNKFSGNAARKRINYDRGKATPPDGVSWPWVRKELFKDALLTKSTLDALKETAAPWSVELDLNDALRLWIHTHSSAELFAKSYPPSVRERFLNLMRERREAMNEILAKAGIRTRIPEPDAELSAIRALHIDEF